MLDDILTEKIFRLDVSSFREKIIILLGIIIMVLLFIIIPISFKNFFKQLFHYNEQIISLNVLLFIITLITLSLSIFLSLKLVFSFNDYLIIDIPENVIWIYRKTFSREKKSFYCSINDIKKISLISRKYCEKGKEKSFYYISFTGIIYFKNNRSVKTENEDEIIIPVKESDERIGLIKHLSLVKPLVMKLTALAEKAGCEVNIDIKRFPAALELTSGNNPEVIKNAFLSDYKKALKICPLCEKITESHMKNCTYCGARFYDLNKEE